jgi:hypothetical protein
VPLIAIDLETDVLRAGVVPAASGLHSRRDTGSDAPRTG